MHQKVFTGWWQVIVCLLLQGISGATIASAFSVVAIPLGEAFEASRMTVMLAMSCVALVTGLLSPVIGPLMDRHSLRNVMALGAVILAAGFVAISFTTSIYQVLAIYGLLLAPANIMLGPMAASVLLSRWFVRKRGRALALGAMGISLGGFFIPPLMQFLFDQFDWRTAFLYIAGFSFLLTVPAIILLVVNHPTEKGLYPDGSDTPPEVTTRGTASANLTTKSLVSDSTFWIITLCFGVILYGLKGVLSNLVPLAMDVGITGEMAALLISVYSGCSFTGKIVFAALADKFNLKVVLAVGLIGFICGLCAFWQAEAGYGVLVAGSILLGLAVGGLIPLQAMMIANAFGQSSVGRVIGLVTLAGLPLNFAAPPLFGFAFDFTGSYDPAVIGFIVVAILALILLPKIRNGERQLDLRASS